MRISAGQPPVRRYDHSMSATSSLPRNPAPALRALIEIAFIIFLFYSNLLMGEFTAASGMGKTLVFALNDIFTRTNMTIALVSALVGYLLFEFFRKEL